MSVCTVLKRVYQTTVPRAIRDFARHRRYELQKVFDPIRAWLRGAVDHNDLYNTEYYRLHIEPTARESAPRMAASIRDVIRPSSVTDVGCGTGDLLLELRNLGIPGTGFEYSTAAIEIAREKGIEVTPLNLEQEIDRLPVRRADLVVSTEVGEHLPESCAETFVEYLCRTADTVLFSAATPGQGGHDHVNEQPHEYWIEKFAARSFVFDEKASREMRRDWELSSSVAPWYWRNVMLFRKNSAPAH